MTISLTVAAQNLRAKIRSTPIILNLTELTDATTAAEASAAAALASQTAAGVSAAAADADATAADADAATATTQASNASASAAAAAASAASIPSTPFTVPDGGTGRASHTAFAVLAGGTTTTAAQQSIASVGTAGQVLTSAGAGALPAMLDVPLPRGHIAGLTIANNAADATNDMDISLGAARDSTNAQNIVLAASITKRLDAAWAVGSGNGGLDTGSIANDTYHVWLIKRSDTGVVDVLFSVSPTAPTMPTNYDFKRLVGSFLRVGAAIVKFLQEGNYFWLETPVQDVADDNPGTTAVTRALSIPTDRKLIANINVAGENGSNNFYVLVSSLDQADIAASATVANYSVVSTGVSRHMTRVQVRTDTSAQVRSRQSASGALDNFFVYTLGWIDSRGKDE